MEKGGLIGQWARDVRPGLYMVAAVCGLIDVTCIKALGGVFAEMMTGNILLMAMDVGSGGTFERSSRYLWPLAAFAIGAILGGRLLSLQQERAVRRTGFLIVWGTIAAAAAICWGYEPNGSEVLGRAITALLALGMGLQTAILRRHGVQDLATNVMTLTLTALLSESRLGEGSHPNRLRRVLSIGCFFSGGVIAAALVGRGTVYPLALAAIVYAIAMLPLMFGEKPN
ncbi:MAG: YoaK family protein [Hyphomicrobiales bacterium]|uniref:YoaK family protein n=1 Tax=Aestuariivirga sp. TaxID=2650926 RepID=UPI0035B0F1CF